jgi:hypothetical protein
MVSEVSRKAADDLADAVWPVKVVRYEQDQLFVNRGEGGELAVGETWTVYALGDDMIDPDTGAALGRSEFPIGKARVVRVAPDFTVAEPLGHLKQAPKVGDILRKD